MSTFTSKLDKLNRKPTFNVDTTDFKYLKLADIFNSEDEIHVINGAFITESQYGLNPVIISEKHKALINLPQHLAASIKLVLADTELINMVKDGKIGFTIYTYESHGRLCYSINYVKL